MKVEQTIEKEVMINRILKLVKDALERNLVGDEISQHEVCTFSNANSAEAPNVVHTEIYIKLNYDRIV